MWVWNKEEIEREREMEGEGGEGGEGAVDMMSNGGGGRWENREG